MSTKKLVRVFDGEVRVGRITCLSRNDNLKLISIETEEKWVKMNCLVDSIGGKESYSGLWIEKQDFPHKDEDDDDRAYTKVLFYDGWQVTSASPRKYGLLVTLTKDLDSEDLAKVPFIRKRKKI